MSKDYTFEPHEEIAIVGMAGRFPGAKDIQEFWQNLRDGVESISAFSKDELLNSGIDSEVLDDSNYVKAGGVLEGIEQFDAAFFGLLPKEAEIMDPQQRIFLECAWEAIEGAGYDPEAFGGRIGVYAGTGMNTYLLFNQCRNHELQESAGSFQATINNDKDFLATRVSYKLNLKGPSITVQTACSTSLVAVHLACQSLLNGECDMALAGGVSVSIPQKIGYLYRDGEINSPDGHCRAFDARAQGTVIGRGVGIVVLKRLEDAQAEGDHIYAVIKGSAINNDGSLKVGYTAPSIDGQAEVIIEAQTVAGVEPETISYIEAHGTATALGDPIEIAALTQAFSRNTDKKGFCAIGSVKTNIGHLDVAAGVTGLIKTALALEHKLLPPSLHFERPNPRIDFANSQFYVNSELIEWKAGLTPRRAGVSSFGIGGTNAHVILEEAPVVDVSGRSRPWQLLVMSAKTDTALQNMATHLNEHLKHYPDLDLADVAYTLQVGRRGFEHRRMLVCQDTEDATNKLRVPDPKRTITAVQMDKKRPIAFLFPGQGAQHIQMALELYQSEPTFREQVDFCSEVLKPRLGLDLRTIIYPNKEQVEEASQHLTQTVIAQPALFVIEYALARLWMEWGVHPEIMVGHSIGEYVAACLAGVFSLEDALSLVATRGQMLQQLPRGAMLAVSLSEEHLHPLLNKGLSLAAVNGPTRCVVSGTLDAVGELEQLLAQKGITSRRLHTSHAFHSKMMEAIVRPFAEQVKKVHLRLPTIPYLSNLTGTWMTPSDAINPVYWARHLRQTVRFADNIHLLLKDSRRIMLEVGPGQTLSTLVNQSPDKTSEHMILSSLRHPQNPGSDMECLLNALGQLWLVGAQIDWSGFHSGEQRHRIPLPTYPFERKRYWLEALAPEQQKIGPKDGDQKKWAIVSQQDIATHSATKEKLMSEQAVAARYRRKRQDRIVEELKNIFANIFGINTTEIKHNVPFLEMGADSLFLIQGTRAIQDALGVKVPFRLLFDELSTIDALASHIDQLLPAEEDQEVNKVLEVYPATSQEKILNEQPAMADFFPASHTNSALQRQSFLPQDSSEFLNGSHPTGQHEVNARSVESTGLEQIVAQQLQIMSQQLDLLRKSYGMSGDSSSSYLKPGTPENPGAEGPFLQTSLNASRSSDPSRIAQQANQEPFVPYKPLQKAITSGLSLRQQKHIDALIERLTKRTQRSKQFAQKYRSVHANSRSTRGFSLSLKELSYRLIVQRAEGSRVWDVDGNRYVDLAMGFGSLLFGHSPSFILEALEEQVKRGLRIGWQSDFVGQVAQLICELTGMERAAFCNSGTEAVMTALRLARTITNRSKVALFAGSYHGTFDGVLVRAQNTGDGGLRTIPMAPGVPQHMIDNVIILHFDDQNSLDILKNWKSELAAVLVELPQSRRPDLQPTAFLHELRRFTQEAGIALIFDEVVAGFRTHPGGAQALFGVRADITTYGKAVGGGLPIGVIAGNATYMDAIDGGMWNFGDTSYPQSIQTYVAGTYFEHPFLMPVVWAILNHLKKSGPQLQQELDQRTLQLVQELNIYFEQNHVPIQVTCFSSLFRFVFEPQVKPIEADLFFAHLLEKGIYIPETRNCFLSTAHTDEDANDVLQAVKKTVDALRRGGFLGGFPPNTPDNGDMALHQFAESSNGSNGSNGSKNDAQDFIDPIKQDPQDEVCTVPLTEAQKELWFLAQMGDDSSRAYNESVTLQMHGPFNGAAMRRAFQEIVNRHEALRTTFSSAAEYQWISSTLTIEVPLVDLSSLDHGEREVEAQEWIATEARCSFDLQKGPLLRVRIIKLEEQYHLLILTYHHIIADGRSGGILLRELSTLYSANCQSIGCQLPQSVQYSEYAQWQTNWLQSSEMQEAESYWLKQFAHVPPTIELPADYPRPPIKTYNGAQCRMSIDPSIYKGLQNLSLQQNCTLFATLLAAFQTLLYRLTGQEDIVVAIPTIEQLSSGTEHLVGHCVNLLPLRSQVAGDVPFTHYLSSLKSELLDALYYQGYPFIRLVQRLNLPRDPSRMPLVNVSFNVDQLETLEFLNLDVRVAGHPTHFAKYDLFFNVFQRGEELEVECIYNTDLFDEQTVQRWIGQWQVLLEGMVAHPDQPIGQLPLLSTQEQNELLEWGKAPAPQYRELESFLPLFEQQVQERPEAIAVVFEQEQVSYAYLQQRANQLAQHLRRLGVGPEVRVGVCLQRSSELLTALLAVLKAGGAYVPLDPSYPADRLAFMIADAQISVLITQQSLLTDLFEQQEHLVCLESDWPSIAQESLQAPEQPLWGEQVAYVIYTSGSTGRPKGVQVRHRGLVNFLQTMQQQPGLRAQDILLAVTTLSFDIAGLELFLPLISGARVVLASREVASDGMALLELVNSSAATIMQATPASWRLLLEAGWSGSEGIRVLCGGEALPLALAQQLLERSAQLWNMYGPTETTIWSMLDRVSADQPEISLGHPIGQTQVYLLDPRLQIVPRGAVGELYIGGEGVARGYVGRPEMTAERFVPDPFSGRAGARLYRTGDQGRWLPDGRLQYLGRLDQQVKLRGYRIEPAEIEAVLRELEEVKEAVVLLRKEPQEEPRLVAYLLGQEPGAELGTERLRAKLKQRLPAYLIPAHYVWMAQWPLTPNGKLDRRALPAPQIHRAPSTKGYQAARTPTERLLVHIWQQVLHIEPIGIDDPFFALGGDSILSIQVVSRAREAGLSLRPRDLFHAPTIAALAALVESQPPALVAEQDLVRGSMPLTPIQHWFFQQGLQAPEHWNQSQVLEVSTDLQAGELQAALLALLSHHDALRLRAHPSPTGWQLDSSPPPAAAPLLVVDLAGLHRQEQEQAQAVLAQQAQSSLDLGHGPLLRALFVLRGAGEPAHLLLLIHHLAVDIVSWSILLDDLERACRQLRAGEPVRLPQKTTSYQEWARRLHAYGQSEQLRGEQGFWQQQPWEAVRPLPLDFAVGRQANTEQSGRQVMMTLSEAETQALLREVPPVYHTQVFEVLLAVLLHTLARWTGEETVLVEVEGHGREELFEQVDLSRTVGWFTTLVPLLLRVPAAEGVAETVKRVKEHWRRLPHGGIGYGVLRYLSEGAPMDRMPAAEVVWNYHGRSLEQAGGGAAGWLRAIAGEAGRDHAAEGKRTHVLEISGGIASGQLYLIWGYSERLHRRESIERLASSYLETLRAFLLHCQSPQAGAYTPSDFPLADLTQQTLDALVASLSSTME